MTREGFHYYRLPRAALSARERELALLLRAGYSKREAAETLGVQLSSIDSYLRGMCTKLGVRTAGELAPALEALLADAA